MRQETIDLYCEYGHPAPQDGGGGLRVWQVDTPEKVSLRRTRPAVLILPGGGYEHLSPRESEPVALRFLARGWVPFVLEYSVAPGRFPAPLREAAMAMDYIRRHAGEYEVDPHKVAAVGFSAGGHLCGMLATLFDSPEVADVAPAEVVRPDAVGLCYPVAVSWGETHRRSFQNLCGGDEALAGRLSLDRLVRRDMPPVFLWCTRDDGSVPCRNTLLLAQGLDQAGVDFALRIYRHGPHGISLADETVYPAGGVPTHSEGISGWPEEMMAFFAESGLVIQDRI